MTPTGTLPPSSSSPLRYLKGVGPKRAQALERLGIQSLRDLLFFFPRRYEDRSHFCRITDMQPGIPVSIRGEILTVKLKRLRHLQILEIVVGDDSGMIHAVWFNQVYLKKQFVEGSQLILFGKAEIYKGRLQLNAPEYEVIDAEEEAVHTGRITPIYPLTEGLFQRSMRMTMKEVVENYLEKEVQDYLPSSFRQEKDIQELQSAIREMHFPETMEGLMTARRRIVYDEFLLFEMVLMRKMERLRTRYKAPVLTDGKKWLERFQAALPFAMTEDQKKAAGEIADELGQTAPMNRLLQGDVGSGKTLVALFALLLAAGSGYQGALLVPTEILAEQHYRTLRQLLEAFQIRTALLTSSTLPPQRERMLAELRQGKIQIVVGTHAILQEDVSFKSLALVVIDEQHKFGVHQRAKLLQNEPRPHQLVMTATPIPRTLAFTSYGDLSISTIRQLPAGRQPIKTWWVPREKQTRVFEHMRAKIEKGEQAYFIFPLIEETEKSDLLAAEKEYKRLKASAFSGLRMGLVHGRMTKEERDAMMNAFRAGELNILVATSVIEVGVDHPNATMMVIENADRFGLAQLHQMRGRIGRGDKASECYVFGEPSTEEGKKRLQIFSRTQDGFAIAEEDMRLRGFGDFLGTRQSGVPGFNLADPVADEALLQDARDTAFRLLRNRMLEEHPEWQAFRAFLESVNLNY